MGVFEIVEVDPRRADALEQLGTTGKYWFLDDAGRWMLFKAEERGTGEDWAEKVASELCARLGLPHVPYQLATETHKEGRRGVVCENCAQDPFSLVLGNQLLMERDPEYPGTGERKYKVRAHTIEAVADVMQRLALPPAPWSGSLPDGISSALGVFTGYVMLDAWIANPDRHHENWGALRTAETIGLAPTFDHGSALARNLSDDERKDRLYTKDRGRGIPRFARRARSAFFAHTGETKPLTTVEAWEAFSRRAPAAARIWREELAAIDEAKVQEVIERVPPERLSGHGPAFTIELLRENRNRLLEESEA